jgi:mono/diheme cytochrome c family protein
LTRSGGAYAARYRWNEAGTGAERVEEGTQDCLTCHHLAAGYVLGSNARQLAAPPSTTRDASAPSQLQQWADGDLLTESGLGLIPVGAALRAPVDPLVPTDSNASLDARARSYLDANCSFCHGPAGSLLDVRKSALLAPLLLRPVRHDFGREGVKLIVPGDPERSLLYLRIASDDPAERMPPVGHESIDEAGAALIGEWIRNLDPDSGSTRR